ncbi:MAG: hypothetical protein ABIW48_03035 [Burkholderiales bacterium]|nr:hypothetical protein [Pseudomonadota bacterium]
MLKKLIVGLDPSDGLEAKLLLDYLAANDQQQWIKRCVLVGYLVVTGQLQIAEDQDSVVSPAEGLATASEALAKKGIGNKLFGIK